MLADVRPLERPVRCRGYQRIWYLSEADTAVVREQIRGMSLPRTHICFGYEPGVTPLVTPPPESPDCEPHEPHPAGYVQHAEWADMMMRTHRVRRCKGCGKYRIWTPKTPGSAQ